MGTTDGTGPGSRPAARRRVEGDRRAAAPVDDLGLTPAALAVLEARYLRRDTPGGTPETPGEMMDRVATHVAAAEDEFVPGSSSRWAERFSAALRALDLLPNSPVLMNAGTPVGLLSACFVLPVEDSLDSIFATLGLTAQLHQAGAGTGFSFSRLRPAGDQVATTQGSASGPVSFLRVFDVATEVVQMSGRRRGANMAVLHVSHPDIEGFVTAKGVPGHLERFNLSVGATDRFLRAAVSGGRQALVNPRTGRVVREVDASELLDRIAEAAWRSGDPGMVFLDRVNRANPVPRLGRIEATNPCGEVPLLANESCSLASVNLARHLDGGRIDWDRLDATIALAVRFLDDVTEVNRHPAPELEAAARRTRKVGVGMMGLADALATLGVPYGSDEAVALAARIARRIRDRARRTSAELAAERGPFPCFADSVFARRGTAPLRNAQLTSIAPTGTISLIAGTTSGIEPMFAVAYTRRVLGEWILEVNPAFERVARQRGLWSEGLAAEVARHGTLGGIPGLPEDLRHRFATALEIAPTHHVRMQAALQRHVDAAVSKTVNLPASASPGTVRDVLVEAWRLGVKGITVYRDGSRPEQVLRTAGALRADEEFAGGCAGTTCTY